MFSTLLDVFLRFFDYVFLRSGIKFCECSAPSRSVTSEFSTHSGGVFSNGGCRQPNGPHADRLKESATACADFRGRRLPGSWSIGAGET